MPRVRATQRSFTAKFKLKQIKWSHENDDNKRAYFEEDVKHVCKWIAECRRKSDELSEL